MSINAETVQNYIIKNCDVGNRVIPKARIPLVAEAIATRLREDITASKEIEQGTLFYNDYDAVLLDRNGSSLSSLDSWYANVRKDLNLKDTAKTHSLYGNAIYLYGTKADACTAKTDETINVRRFICIAPEAMRDNHPGYTDDWITNLKSKAIQNSTHIAQLPCITGTIQAYLKDYLNDFITLEALKSVSSYDFPNTMLRVPLQCREESIIPLDI